jgi:3-oxoacyl-[acyl-carrier-protein] synthase II
MARTEGDAPVRVVVTGMGAVSAVGWGVESLWRALHAARTGLGPFSRFDHASQRTHLAGEVPPATRETLRRLPGWKRLAFADRFALFAALEALEQAGLERPLDDRTAGVFFATSTGGLFEGEGFVADLWEGAGRGRLSSMASHQLNAPGDAVARCLGVTGPVRTVSSACASGALALEDALRSIRSGEVDLAISGASDSLCTTTYAGFNSLRAVDEKPCRPFQEGRAGMSLGEGSAVLVLERLEGALARGAEPLAEFLGAGASCDANHMTAPHPGGVGAAAALQRGLQDAGVQADEIGLFNAHGTGTLLNDASEFEALAKVFGERVTRLPVSATKSIVGHLLGASGAIEAVATVLCLRAREGHPAAGGGGVDPKTPVDLILGEPRPLPEGRAAVSASFGFGGANAALVFGPWTAP